MDRRGGLIVGPLRGKKRVASERFISAAPGRSLSLLLAVNAGVRAEPGLRAWRE